jgi:hypothetical protein
MMIIESGVDGDRDPKQEDGTIEDQLHRTRSIGRRLAAGTRRLSAIIEAEPKCVRILNAGGPPVQMKPAGLQIAKA